MCFIVSETSSAMSTRWVMYKQYVALSPAFTQSGTKLSHLASSLCKTQSARIADEADHSLAQPQESYLLQVITQLSVNTVTGDTMPWMGTHKLLSDSHQRHRNHKEGGHVKESHYTTSEWAQICVL